MALIPINISTGSLQQEELIIGIDLGTTNSLVAFINPENKAITVNDAGKGILVPSVIHFQPDGSLLVGNDAKNHLIDDPEHTIFSVKRLLGRSFRDIENHKNFFGYQIIDDQEDSLVKVRVNDRFYTPIELSSFILKELKNRAEHALKTKVNKAVITVPAYFNDNQRQATRDAGKIAGLDVLRIINEPTAASLAYGIGLNPAEEKTIAIYDLGGGTFDISILKIQQGIFEVLSTNGNTFLGGDDFDRLIIEHWMRQYEIDPKLFSINRNQGQSLRLKAEEAKKALSSETIWTSTWEGIELQLSLIAFEGLIQGLVDETIACCSKALQDAGLTTSQIDVVVMVGGSTRTPLVKKSISKFFEKEVFDSINPDEVVALGAAIQADVLSGNRSDILLLDVTPLSLGIETMGGLMDVIIPRNSKIPTKAGRQYTTQMDGQTGIKITVFQGERDLVSENRKLAEFDLKGIPPMPAGLPKVEINFLLNADGILKVIATELRSGINQEVNVKPTYGLSDEEVERMLLDSIQHAKDDVEKRMIIEARTEAEQLIYTAGNFLVKQKDFLEEPEIKQTNLLIEQLRQVLLSEDKNLIQTKIEDLNEYTRPFAERVMDISIANSMKGKKI